MVSKRFFTVGILFLPAVLGCSSSNDQSGTASQAPASPPIAAAPQIAPPPPSSAAPPNQKGAPAGPSPATAPPSTAPTPTAVPSPTSVPPDRRTLPDGPLPATLVWYEKGERFERKVEIGRRQAIVLKESLPSREPNPSRVVIESSRGGAPTTRTNPDAEMGSIEFIDPASGDKMFRTVSINFPDRVSWNSSSIYGPNDPQTVEDEVREPGEPIDMEVPLPGRATDVVVGADGRYLIISMHASRQAAIFDVREGAVKRVLNMPTDDFVIAAGASRFVVVDRGQGTLTRYAFATL
jgi:hypothetical protein